MSTEVHKKKLQKVVDDELEVSFATSDYGMFTFNKRISITIGKKTIPICKNLSHEEPLKKLMPAAPFGHGLQTLFDQRVRHAHQLPATAFKTNFEIDKTDIVDDVKSSLVPYLTCNLTAELYSLNLYPTGGHFEMHKDTPRADTLGTLVVVLPSPYEGGTLTVKHHGHEEEFESGEDNWIAFFGDCDHSISQITKGTRITLVYNLVLERSESIAPVLDAKSKLFADALQQALMSPNFMPNGGKLGIRCAHLYNESEIDCKKYLTKSSAQRLKGQDNLIANGALLGGLKTKLQVYVRVEDYELFKMKKFVDDKDLGLAPPEIDPMTHWLPQVTPSSIRGESLPYEHKKDKSKEFGFDFDEPPREQGIEWLEAMNGIEKEIGSAEYGEWFGNEASDAGFYIHACLIMDIPKRSARKTQGMKRKRKQTKRTKKR